MNFYSFYIGTSYSVKSDIAYFNEHKLGFENYFDAQENIYENMMRSEKIGEDKTDFLKKVKFELKGKFQIFSLNSALVNFTYIIKKRLLNEFEVNLNIPDYQTFDVNCYYKGEVLDDYVLWILTKDLSTEIDYLKSKYVIDKRVNNYLVIDNYYDKNLIPVELKINTFSEFEKEFDRFLPEGVLRFSQMNFKRNYDNYDFVPCQAHTHVLHVSERVKSILEKNKVRKIDFTTSFLPIETR